MADSPNSLSAPILPTPSWSFPPAAAAQQHQPYDVRHHHNDGPFNYSPSLLAPIDGLGDANLARRWSTSTAEVSHHHHHHYPSANQQRPWTASSHPHTSYHHQTDLPHPLLPPQTSSTLVSSTSYNDHFSSSAPNTRPSTTSSLSSAPIQTPLELNYTLDLRNVDPRPSSASQISPLGSNGAPSLVSDDSNPFFFQRQLQTLHEQEPLSASSTTSSFSGVDNVAGGASSRPGSMGLHSHTQQQAYQPPRSAGNQLPFPIRRASASSKSQEYLNNSNPGGNGANFYDYATPPDTGTSTTSTVYFDHLPLTPQPQQHHQSSLSPPSNQLYQQQPGYPPPHNRRISLQGDPYPQPFSDSPFAHLDGDHHSQQRQQQSHSSSSNNAAGPSTPSPYSLIVPNPDPATAAARPHLCTHCQETFRRIHDAKRHAYGAMGIKNYACMGGCGMTFKRSEGRARHWMREEVAGVGSPVPVPGVALGPGGTPIWGGKGCEDRHALMMSGTMEEDRRLRNKARRERIMMMQAAKSAGSNAPVKLSPAAIATAQALGLTTRNAGVVKSQSNPQLSQGGNSPPGARPRTASYGAPY